MTCAEVEVHGHGGRDHNCIGDQGHPGPHWCLLGHTWETTSKEDEE